MRQIIKLNLLVLLAVIGCQLIAGLPHDGSLAAERVFEYQGALPIKDDRAEPLKDEKDSDSVTKTPEEQAEAEESCWKLINEQSATTFALQNKVLDELEEDLKKYTLEENLQKSIDKIIKRLRSNLKEALEALAEDAADTYFDALFEQSEDIVYFSTLLRDPKMDEGLFITLVKAVSRLNRNNSALIQGFTDMCSFMQRSPRPRAFLF